jgi:Domain of unknown function (DUF5666)
MNAAHLHLILNHVPVLGVVFAGLLLGTALWYRSAQFQRVALVAMVGSALVAVPVYLTGERAEEAVEHVAGVSETRGETTMKWITESRRTWIVVGLLALLVLGLAPGAALADRDRAQGKAGEFYGVVDSLPGTAGWVGDWSVDGRTVRVEPGTRIEQEQGQPAVGAYVEVKGQPPPDGSLRATKIEVKRRAGRS